MFVLYFRGVSKAQHCDTIPEGAEKQKFSTTTINDRQLSRQKFRQKISVIKTKQRFGEFEFEYFGGSNVANKLQI